MRLTLIIICLLISSVNTYAVKTTISGHFRYKPKKNIKLEYYATIIDKIERRKTRLETLVDDNKAYTLTFDIGQPILVTLQNGYNSILYNVYIFPGDSIHLYTTKYNTYASGKGSGNVQFMLKFAKCNSSDSVSYWEGYKEKVSPFNNKTIDDAAPIPYAKHWERKKNSQLNFLKEHLKGSTISQDFAHLFEHHIMYEYAWKLLNYRGLYRKKYEEEAQKGAYQSYLKSIPIDDTSTWVTYSYFNLLYARTPYWKLPSNDIRDDNNPNTITYFKNDIKTWDSLAKKQFNASTYKVALYYKLYLSTFNRFYKLASQAPSDSARAIRKQVIKAHAQLLEQPLQKRIDSLLKISNGEKAVAPNFAVYNYDGKKVQLSDHKDKIVVLTFWSAMSQNSIRDIRNNKKNQKKVADNKDVVFLYISLDRDKRIAQQLIQEKDFTGTHLFSPDGIYSDIARKYSVKKLPRYILIDKKGFIVNNDVTMYGPYLGTSINELLVEE